MPKVKVRNSVTKRFKITKNGKVLRRQSFRRHLKAGKSSNRLMNLKRTVHLSEVLAKKIRKIVGAKNTHKKVQKVRKEK